MSESKDLATHQGGREVYAQPTAIPIDQQMVMMQTALTDPNVNPASAREMFALLREMQQEARQAEFNRDKIAAKAAMPALYKRGRNSHQNTKYVLFEDMQRAIDPVLEQFNIMLDFEVSRIPGGDIQVVPILRHKNGWIERGGALSGPPDTGPGRSAIQSIGSSAHYLMRYAAEAMLNLVRDGEDNDGQIIREDTLLNDRQAGLVVDAQAAADRGEYRQWFDRLNTKDKAVIIGNGTHARLGGAPMLPGAKTADPAIRREDPPAKEGLPASPDVRTAEGWTEQFEIDCRNAPNFEALKQVQTKGANAIAKLKDTNEALWNRAIDAGDAARNRLIDSGSDGNATTAPAGGLFGDDA